MQPESFPTGPDLPGFITERYHRTFEPELARLGTLAYRCGYVGAASRIGSLLARLADLLAAHVREQERAGGTFEALAHGASSRPAGVDGALAELVSEVRADPALLSGACDPCGKALRFGLRHLADEVAEHLLLEQRLFTGLRAR